MAQAVRLSVIVPAHNAADLLPITLAALAASDLPRATWELLVVDDASRDATSQVAGRWADQVLTLAGHPRGPGHARNRGAVAARGEWLVFIDADVRVHADTLRRFVQAVDDQDGLGAVFGAYDTDPPAPGFLSAYRNLLHRYVHLTSAGEAETFWAGCGAVRREAFLRAGGFDEVRFPRPQIEDIDLGYRLRDAGWRIVLDPGITGTHLKRWRFLGALRTDLMDRGIPWVQLLLERRSLARPAPLNLKGGERAKVAITGLGLLSVLLAAVLGKPALLLGTAAAALVVIAGSAPMLRWFARTRGPWFAAGVVPYTLLYYVVSGVAVIGGGLRHLRGGGAPGPRPPLPDPVRR